MARVTVEDCLEQVPNRFALTVLGSRRARALSEGKGTALVKSSNKVGVVALREIAKALVRYDENVEETIRGFIEEQRAQLMAGSNSDATFIDAATFGTGDDEDDEDDDDVKELPSDPDKLQDDDDDDDDEDGDDDTPEGTEPDSISDGDDIGSDDDDGVEASVLGGLDEDDDDDDDDDKSDG
ncbi:DNA-directed RNA polymerase subunit omega [Enhygromyxa salina]|uniref:DNA-directed RNA polymerase subunit omega n=1 Tax=Enhygromyxa salina TaxID=215803 RepID=A0A2S9XS20_9BACT|nr:DNA-directed RNA polymerase subunit omega [Enhygromyxa salina]PRP95646.1 DNA-directed RNA polymerase subunit omega [Enhygromyxa salina]